MGKLGVESPCMMARRSSAGEGVHKGDGFGFPANGRRGRNGALDRVDLGNARAFQQHWRCRRPDTFQAYREAQAEIRKALNEGLRDGDPRLAALRKVRDDLMSSECDVRRTHRRHDRRG